MTNVVASFPNYVRIWTQPGVASYLASDAELEVIANGMARPELSDQHPLDHFVQTLVRNVFWQISGQPVLHHPTFADQILYGTTLKYVESTLRNKLDTFDQFAAYLKDVHARLIDPNSPQRDLRGEFRPKNNVMSNRFNDSDIFIDTRAFCKKEKLNLTDNEVAELDKLVQLLVRNIDLEVIEAKRMISDKLIAILRKYAKIYPHATRVDALMRAAFVQFTALCKAGDSVKAACFVHAEIVGIHPFENGNGRVARILLNRTLMLGTHQPIAFISREKYGVAVITEQEGKVGAFEKFVRPLVAEYDYEALLPDQIDTTLMNAYKLQYLWENGAKKAWYQEKNLITVK